LAATIVITWPLVLGFGDCLPLLPAGDGEQDTYLFAWNLWWFHEAVTSGQSPFFCSIIGIPEGTSLALSTLSPANGLLAFPLLFVLPLEAVYNLIVFASFLLSGAAGFWLARRLGFGWWPAALAGLTLLGCRSRLVHLFCHLNILSSQWFFWCMAAAFLWRWERSRLALVLLAVTPALAVGSSWYFLPLLALFLGLFLPWTLVGGKAGPAGAGGWVQAFAAVLVSLLLMLPFVLPAVREYLGGRSVAPPPLGAEHVSADLLHFILPAWGLANNKAALLPGFLQETHLFLGFAVLGLALVGLWAGRLPGKGLWAILAGVGFVLALGPELRTAGGGTGLPLPYALVESLPVLSGARVPARFFLLAELPLALFVAAGAERLRQQRQGPVRAALMMSLLTVVLVVERTLLPIPTTSPDSFTSFQRSPSTEAVLTLPLTHGARRTLYDQTRHRRPIPDFFQARPLDKEMFATDWLRRPGQSREDWTGEVIDLAVFLGATRLGRQHQAGETVAADWGRNEFLPSVELVSRAFVSVGYSYCDLNVTALRTAFCARDGVRIYPWKGWYPPETLADGKRACWGRGTEATLLLAVPPGRWEARVELVLYGYPGVEPITVQAFRGKQLLGTLRGQANFTRHLLPVAIDGEMEGVVDRVRLVADRSYTPAVMDRRYPEDARKLSFRLSNLAP
jgi:hypothetical protein